jgi:hypothetical protein
MCLKPPQRRRELGLWLHSLPLKVLDISWDLVSRNSNREAIPCRVAILFDLSSALGLMFVPLGTEGLSIEAIKFRLNMYTGPGYLNALLGVVAIILLVSIFHESKLIQSKRFGRNNIPTKLKLLSALKEMKQVSAGPGEYCTNLLPGNDSIHTVFVYIKCMF